ncbi:MAG: DNA repair exonuclease [Candidatus Aenigmarchaeota archaeon]|nr:DNA repair exonuclease [Candidatus Aenigmarchaeota archaeon]
MKLAVLSDFHFGFGYNSELETDSFDNADEAMQRAIEGGADLVLIAGDIFDLRYPKTPVWTHAMRILTRPLLQESTGVRMVSCTKELKPISKHTLQHLPVVSLHGNHEFRSRDSNTLEALENAGLLVHLHKDAIVFEKDGVRVAIHGMSWVPDRYAKRELDEWNPQPIAGCTNILMMHQSIAPYIFSPLDAPSLTSANMPKGFDLIFDGHLHRPGSDTVDGTPLMFVGSTVITQFEKGEAGADKGYYDVELLPNELPAVAFRPIANGRRFFFEEVATDGGLRQNIESRLDSILAGGFAKKPMVRVKITGKQSEYVPQDVKEIERAYGDRAILRFVNDLESPEMADKAEMLRSMRDQGMTVEEKGLQLLHESLQQLQFGSSFETQPVFDLLVDGRVDSAFDILTGQQSTLAGLAKK